MLIKGSDLNAHQKSIVLRAFIYRWTAENPNRDRAYKNISKPTMPLKSDQEWLNEHAFYFVRDGSRLNRNYRHCEPAYMADE